MMDGSGIRMTGGDVIELKSSAIFSEASRGVYGLWSWNLKP